MIVTRKSLRSCLAALSAEPALSVDTETYGLNPYHGDNLFSIIVASETQSYYFNFKDYTGEQVAVLMEDLELVRAFFRGSRLWYFHNARFDLAMLRNLGIEVGGTIHDSMAIARVLDSTLFPNQFSLNECARSIDMQKDDAVKTWILKNKAFTESTSQGKKTKSKNLHFDRVPLSLIVPYGEQDAEITFKLGAWQVQEVAKREVLKGLPAMWQVMENERALTRTVFEMEAAGVMVDRDFCQRAIEDTQDQVRYLRDTFYCTTGTNYQESTLLFQRIFADEKDAWTYGALTATGKTNPCFDSDALAALKSPAAAVVLALRKTKSDSDYYNGFLDEADAAGVIHASFNQHGAATGRFSSSSPNLQNLTKDEDDDLLKAFVVRRAIVPRPGNVFHMLDYRAMEYMLMLDYAARDAYDPEGVLALIAKVLGGLDVHQATADIAGVTRRQAKTTNFATLYGSGITLLANRLGTSEKEARAIRTSIFRAAPEIETLIRRATTTAEKRGSITNWFGRRCDIKDARYAYRATNYLIQGGCADVVKVAMNRVHAALQPFETRLVLMIHDELVLEGPPAEGAAVVPLVKEIMESVYPYYKVPLTCGIDHSYRSLADKIEGIAQ